MVQIRVTVFGLCCLAPAFGPVEARQPGRSNLFATEDDRRKFLADIYQDELKRYEENVVAYKRSQAAFLKAREELDKGELGLAIRSLEAGHTAVDWPRVPDPPGAIRGIGRNEDGFSLLRNGGASARIDFLTEFHTAISKKLSDSPDPWKTYNELLRTAEVKTASACLPFTCLALERAARFYADLSLERAIARAEADDWAGVVDVVSRARGMIETHFRGMQSAFLRQYVAAFDAVLSAHRATVQLKVLAAALGNEAGATGLRDAPLDDLSWELVRPIRAATAADELRAALAANRFAFARTVELLDQLSASEPSLANRVRVDVAGRLFLAGESGKARAVLDAVAGKSPVAAGALLRDLKAVAIGEGSVATDAGRAGVGSKSHPPATRQFTPEGDRAGYRLPAAGKTPPDLPPLEQTLAAFVAAARAEARAELALEPARLERRKIEALTELVHARPSDRARRIELFLGAALTDIEVVRGDWTRKDATFDDKLFLHWVRDLLPDCTEETKRQLLDMRRASPQITVVKAVQQLPQPRNPFARRVEAELDRQMTAPEARVASYLEDRKWPVDEVADWLRRGAAPAVAPVPRAKLIGGAP